MYPACLFGSRAVALMGHDGFVRAETIQQAVALVGHPEVNVYTLPADAVWPGDPGEAVWRCG